MRTHAIFKSLPVCDSHRLEVHERQKAFDWSEAKVVTSHIKMPCVICRCQTNQWVKFRKVV